MIKINLNLLKVLAFGLIFFGPWTNVTSQDGDGKGPPLEFDSRKIGNFFHENSDKIKISGPEGAKLINSLKSSLVSQSTTSCRKEQKGVISERTWRMIQHVLKRGNHRQGVPPIFLKERDAVPRGGFNSTITFYGKGVVFPNQETQTNFILRTRFYMEIEKDVSTGEMTSIKRSSTTINNGWMEIKVRNPSSEEILGVNKYRVKMSDEDILALFSAHPERTAVFEDLIRKLKEKAKLNPENKAEEVEAFFDVVEYMGKINSSFIKPQMVVSYERTAFKYIEENYPVLERDRRRSRDEAENPSVEKMIEYQVTVDENITYYRPKINPFTDKINLTQYYRSDGRLVLAKFPSQANAIEFKDPFPIANYGQGVRSRTHQFFYDGLMETIHSDQFILPGFIKNKGKAGHFRQLLDSVP